MWFHRVLDRLHLRPVPNVNLGRRSLSMLRVAGEQDDFQNLAVLLPWLGGVAAHHRERLEQHVPDMIEFDLIAFGQMGKTSVHRTRRSPIARYSEATVEVMDDQVRKLWNGRLEPKADMRWVLQALNF